MEKIDVICVIGWGGGVEGAMRRVQGSEEGAVRKLVEGDSVRVMAEERVELRSAIDALWAELDAA